MDKKIRFTATALFILLTRSYDAYSTYRLTPDLSKEANPIVTLGGVSSWSTLLLIIGCLTAYALFAYYKAVFSPYNLLPNKGGMPFKQFVPFVYLGTSSHWSAIFYKFPKSWKRLNQFMGEVLTKALVYAGVVSTTMWLLIKYTSFYKSVHSPTLIYSVLILGTIIISYFWYRKKYTEYRQSFAQ